MSSTLDPGRGRVVALRGPVIDITFDAGHLPPIDEALRIDWDQPGPLIAEVQSHLDEATVSAVALQPTAGLRRGEAVEATGRTITMPVGDAVLGRLLDVIGNVQDLGPALAADTPRWPIHRQPPPLAAQTRTGAIFETGIKVIDLLVPLAQGGKAAMFGPAIEAFGRVQTIGDGIAMISGLPAVRLDEVLQFQRGQLGFAQTLDRDLIGCVLLDDAATVEAGDTVRGTGTVIRTPVGSALLGRIIDPLGRPLDDGPPIEATAHDPIEAPAPSIIERDLVTEPVQTGILTIDALFALGRGQRELIIGDRSTGKTSVAVDTVINQRNSDLICVYIAVGQKSSAVARVIDAVRQHGNPSRCIFVVAAATASPGLQWIAPFAGMTMAEHFRNHGQHALVVIDDLTKHAATHREIAPLTRQPPGREAYPGDVFYLHARLLERAAKLSPARGGGSLTALPIAETDAGNLSAYIPTNLISITDGQLVLNARLFQEGQKPAIDIGTSVSRVGGKTQAPAMREAAGTMRLDYAQFLELEMFSQFGGVPDARVKQQLARGVRLRALLSQPQYAPLRLADQVALALALRDGALDPIAPEKIAAYRMALPAWLDEHAEPALRALGAGGKMNSAQHDLVLTAVHTLAQQSQDQPP